MDWGSNSFERNKEQCINQVDSGLSREALTKVI